MATRERERERERATPLDEHGGERVERLAQAVDGEEAEYEDLWGFARRAARSTDIAHEALVAHFLAARRGEQIQHSEAFVLVAVRRLAMARYRAARSQCVTLDASWEPISAAPPIDEATIDGWMRAMPRSLAAWLSDCRNVMPLSELARRDGISVRAVCKRGQRVQDWIRRHDFEIPGSG